MQCGHCPGFVVIVKVLLDRNHNPAENEVKWKLLIVNYAAVVHITSM